MSSQFTSEWLRAHELRTKHRQAEVARTTPIVERRADVNESDDTEKRRYWSLLEDGMLTRLIRDGKPLDEIARQIGRSRAGVACRAHHLKITNGMSVSDLHLESVFRMGERETIICAGCGISFFALKKWERRFCSLECSQKVIGAELGQRTAANAKDHGEVNCKICGKKVKRTSKNKTQLYCSRRCSSDDPEVAKKVVDSRRESQKVNPVDSGRFNVKRGWRTIGGQKCYFRSSWEANYARFLQFQKENGLILDWEHEPHTFWFESIKRGCRSYLPDFRVVTKGGEHQWHEVKGWMDARSKTVLKRMKKYYPKEIVIVIDGARMKSLRATCRGVIQDWE